MPKVIFRPMPQSSVQPSPVPYRLLVEKVNVDPGDFSAKVQFLNQPPDTEEEIALVVAVNDGQSHLELCQLTECRSAYPDYSTEWMENMDECNNPTFIQVGYNEDTYLPCEVTFVGF